METKPIVADDAEQQWIAKYRRAIEVNNLPVRRGIAPLRKSITGMFEKVRWAVGRILEPCIRAQFWEIKTAGKHSGPKIDHSKLRPHAVSFGLKVGDSRREKAS